MKKLLKLLIGLLLIPMCWSMSRTIYLFLTADSLGPMAPWALPTGCAISVISFILLPPAFRTYVLGHEATHAIAGLLMGAKVGKMKVGPRGGHVELSKTNSLIALAPYVIPFYTALAVLTWVAAGWFWEISRFQTAWLMIVGLTWGFHILFTVYMLTQRQPDVQEHGRVFSYVVIYLANLLCIAAWLGLIGSPTLSGMWSLFAIETSSAYEAGASWLDAGARRVLQLF